MQPTEREKLLLQAIDKLSQNGIILDSLLNRAKFDFDPDPEYDEAFNLLDEADKFMNQYEIIVYETHETA